MKGILTQEKYSKEKKELNIEELKTNIENAPMSGLILFSLTAKISHPELDYDLLFLWDSVGSIPCKMTFDGKGGSTYETKAEKDAKAIAKETTYESGEGNAVIIPISTGGGGSPMIMSSGYATTKGSFLTKGSTSINAFPVPIIYCWRSVKMFAEVGFIISSFSS